MAMRTAMQPGSVLSGRTARPSVRCAGLKENVAALAAPTGVTRISFPQLSHEIMPMQGKMASVAIYNHLALKHGGRLTADAAREALALYDEVVADAKAHPGSHPNIDLLFKVLDTGMQVDIVVERQ